MDDVWQTNPVMQESGSADTRGPRAEDASHSWNEVPHYAWIQIGVVTGLFIALHWTFLHQMGKIARTDADWSHAFLIPFISLYFVHTLRHRLLETRVTRCWWALPVFLMGLGAYFLAIFPVRSPMFQGYAIIIELMGLTLFLLGPAMFKYLAFPIAYLGFGVKISGEIWDMITRVLQKIAANSAAVLLNLVGIEADISDTTIELWRGAESLGALNVAEACSGLRMLVAFLAIGFALTYLGERPWWARGVMLAMAVPIAVTVNVLRVTITGMLHLVNPELSAGDFHVFVGILMIFPALGFFVLLGYILDNLVVEEPEDDTEPA